jgi:hypothetical protein
MSGSARIAAILGAPRSGTTWLQQLLGSHDQIVTPQETSLFNEYLRPLHEAWDRQENSLGEVLVAVRGGEHTAGRLVGLPTILEPSRFDDLSRAYIQALQDACLAAKPSARLVLEKTPSNSYNVRLIKQLSPAAKLVHLVRDPRDVVVSLLDASAWELGSARWVPRTAEKAAIRWLRHFNAAREGSQYGDDYLEVRYEDLRQDPTRVLGSVLTFLDITTNEVTVNELVQSSKDSGHTAPLSGYAFNPKLAAKLGTTVAEPAGFARAPGQRRRSLSRRERAIVDDLLGPTMRDLGYVSDSAWVDLPAPARAAVAATASTGRRLRSKARNIMDRGR